MFDKIFYTEEAKKKYDTVTAIKGVMDIVGKQFSWITNTRPVLSEDGALILEKGLSTVSQALFAVHRIKKDPTNSTARTYLDKVAQQLMRLIPAYSRTHSISSFTKIGEAIVMAGRYVEGHLTGKYFKHMRACNLKCFPDNQQLTSGVDLWYSMLPITDKLLDKPATTILMHSDSSNDVKNANVQEDTFYVVTDTDRGAPCFYDTLEPATTMDEALRNAAEERDDTEELMDAIKMLSDGDLIMFKVTKVAVKVNVNFSIESKE